MLVEARTPVTSLPVDASTCRRAHSSRPARRQFPDQLDPDKPRYALTSQKPQEEGMRTMILNETFDLSNGEKIPKLGLGTWFIDDDRAAQAVRDAVQIGYRNIDTAQAYGNEQGVGEGVRTADVARDQLFVSTKLAAEIKDFDQAVAAIDGSLAKLGLDYVDLMMIHSPQPWNDFRGGNYDEGNREAWRALEKAHHEGKVRSIGISNFLKEDVDNILGSAQVAPQVNQLLVHIGNTPQELIDYCTSKDILVEAYSPMAHGEMMGNERVRDIAEDNHVTVPQLSIRYALQLGTVPLPKTANPDHMRANAQVDFVISDDDMATLRGLDQTDYGKYTKFPVYSGK
ncbi:Aldo/keto reductases, related to diketogulonate reductase [Propionibacterium freudenreichii]|jgi:diketogulonate reductase-like aldo/keto reductase|nr:Aldo/keto reductases, related to diketogulonate reductase [Propionibacterium freudenreichii]CEG91145.1 Aldo/keto reductases, related to diketogulonate reductase [Propionibacterium freudenreichii]CEG92905.1 Aldo/keto reductases, related to diketogulonate reductase [Propionibacterium freudenreichii]CEH04473.1 Aldo/keto reductases, related to diketogulonate reductase [Propionibacterium freudenreichii]CEI27791.1 Aldo/keto reductases, related to diketogulonate reductase [Propionibacterium freuden